MKKKKKAMTKHFHSQDVGLPWDLDNKDEMNENDVLKAEGPKISFSFLNPTIKRINRAESIATFTIRLVCTINSDGLYDLSTVSGKASTLLVEEIVTDVACAAPLLNEVKINLFDFKHGYKQSLMEQQYTSRLRG